MTTADYCSNSTGPVCRGFAENKCTIDPQQITAVEMFADVVDSGCRTASVVVVVCRSVSVESWLTTQRRRRWASLLANIKNYVS